MLSRRGFPSFAVACLASCLGTLAHADIVSFGGSVALRTPPADISLGLWESATEARLWSERNITLASPLSLDTVNTGTVTFESELAPGQVSAGTTVASFMLHADSVGSTQSIYSGFVIFDQPILGLMVLRPGLNGSDGLLGLPGVVYNTNAQRGLEFFPQIADPFTVSADRLRIDFMFTVSDWTDEIRIVTAVPSPGGLALILLGSAGLARRSRRSLC